jgi:hypothetical protein
MHTVYMFPLPGGQGQHGAAEGKNHRVSAALLLWCVLHRCPELTGCHTTAMNSY